LVADLTAFGRGERDITLGRPPCDTTVDFDLTLRPRRDTQASSGPDVAQRAQAGPGARDRGAAAQPAGPRVQELNVQADATAAAALDAASAEDGGDVARLLPPGFSIQTAQSDAIAINGSSDATNLDRGQMNDRLQAIRLLEFDPAATIIGGAAGADGVPGAAPFGAVAGDFGGRGAGR